MDRQPIITEFHPDVLAAHAEFGGDLPTMQRAYEWYDLKKENESLRTDHYTSENMRHAMNDEAYKIEQMCRKLHTHLCEGGSFREAFTAKFIADQIRDRVYER